VHALQLIYITHTHIAKARFSFCTSTRSCNAVNRSIFRIIKSIYMHRNHIHCKDTTQSLLIYTERQERLCTRAATNIRHSHSHCKGMTQLLCTYIFVRCSKSIGFSIFWLIYMRHKYIDQSSSTFIYVDQSSSSSLSLMIIQTSWKLTLKWSAFTILSCLCDHLII